MPFITTLTLQAVGGESKKVAAALAVCMQQQPHEHTSYSSNISTAASYRNTPSILKLAPKTLCHGDKPNIFVAHELFHMPFNSSAYISYIFISEYFLATNNNQITFRWKVQSPGVNVLLERLTLSASKWTFWHFRTLGHLNGSSSFNIHHRDLSMVPFNSELNSTHF